MRVYNLNLIILAFLLSFGAVYAQDTLTPTQRVQLNQEFEEDEVVEQEKRAEIIEDAERAKEEFRERNPNIENLYEVSAGYAIFPNVGKGAYILGGAAGNGVVYENDEIVGFAELRQVDVGLQLGGQAFSQIIFFETQEDLMEFKEGNLEFGGNASAVIIEEGRAESINFNDGIAVATMPKAGAMLEISIGGQKFNYGSIE